MVLPLLLGLVAPLLLATWYSLVLQRRALDDAHRFEMANMVNVLAKGMQDPIWNLTPNSGAALVDSLLEDRRVISVEVTSNAQKAFLSAGRELLEGEQPLTLTQDVTRDGEKIGEVILVVDDGAREAIGWAAWRRIVIVSGLQLVLSVGVVFFVAYLVRRVERNQILQRTNKELRAEIEVREQAEKKLRVSEERLSLTIEASGDGVWDWNIKTGELFWSGRLMEMLGVDRAQFDHRIDTFFDRLCEDDRERVQTTLDAHFKTRKPYNVRFRMKHSDGRLIDVAAKGQAAWNSNGDPVRMVGTISDISELVKSNDLLLLTERLANIGHWQYELPGQTLHWSAETYRIQGFEPFEFEPALREAIACFHPEDRPAFEAALSDAIQSGTPFEFDARVVRPSGEIRHVHCTGVVSANQAGETIAVYGTIQDRTRQVEQEHQLIQAQKMEAFGQLSGGVAHDFNNLLAVIMGNIELLEDEVDPAVRRELGNSALEAVIRGRDLTSSLLNFARTAPLMPKRIELRDIADGLQKIIRRTLPATQDITFDVPETIWPIQADPTTLDSCILNLALNARDAMPDGGRLTISADNLLLDDTNAAGYDDLAPGRYVVLEVSDTGTGISDEDVERVFEPFFTTKPVGKGSGLGLSRVRGFAEQSGGMVSLETKADAGTKVRIILPASADAQASGAGQPQPAGSAAPSGESILLVEDMEDVRETLERRLIADGYKVTSADSGDKAFELVEAGHRFDVLITDIVMPGRLQGTGLAASVKGLQPDIGIIFMSGHPSGALDAANTEGAEIYLTKPISKADLYAALDQVIQSRSQAVPARAASR